MRSEISTTKILLAKKGGRHGVAGIPGKARENTEKCPLENKWQCPTTVGTYFRTINNNIIK